MQKSKNQKETPLPLSPDKPYYVASVPAEPPEKNPGKVEGIISIICSVISLIVFPFSLIFGITGIILGVKAKSKGAYKLGLAGIILSIVFMILGNTFFVMSILFSDLIEESLEGAIGGIFKI